jgi:hypothetical protein
MFNTRQELINFITEMNWRYMTCYQQLANAQSKVFSKVNTYMSKHNAAVSAFTTAKNDTGYKTANIIDGTTVGTTQGTDDYTTLQTNYLTKLKAAVTGTMGTYAQASSAYSPKSHMGWMNDWSRSYGCLAASPLKWDGLYDGVVVGCRYRMRLPEYQIPSVWNDGVFTAQAVSMTNYENLWKAYYNVLINAASNVRSGASVTSKYLIEQCQGMQQPKKYYDIIDGISTTNATTAILFTDVFGYNNANAWTPEDSFSSGLQKFMQNIGKDLIDWKYNRVPTMLADYVTKANSALEYLKQKDSTGEFKAWVKSSKFTICQKPYGATLVYNDYTNGQYLKNEDWNDPNNKYYHAYGHTPDSLPYHNPFNRDLYCSKSDIDSGRIKVAKGDY